MRWNKKGLIYTPNSKNWWSKYYGLMPTPDMVDKNKLRIYFTTTDENRFGRIAYIEVDSREPNKILYSSPEPVLDIGEIGTFDDCGVAPSCILNTGEKKFLYYVGFQRTVRVPYMLFTGLAISEDSGRSFNRYSKAPILERNKNKYISIAAPYVLRVNGIFKMWYWFGTEWTEINRKLYMKSNIGYAESDDGITWKMSDKTCIGFQSDDEFGIGRPWVLFENNLYRMWYSVRTKTKLYRIGYAESKNGLDWVRKDGEVGIDVSDKGWDSEMICYPAVISVNGVTYMFYNGNNNGESGFGYAERLE